MDSENNYDITPINNHCSSSANVKIISQPGSENDISIKNANTIQNQHIADAQYDISTDLNVKPMYGGLNKINKKFKIIFRENTFYIDSKDEINAMKEMLNGKVYKKNYLIEIYNQNKKSIYVLISNKKNKFKKLY
jgi:hypothetical protein